MNLAENISEIVQLSRSSVGKNSAIVLTGNIIGSGFAFIATILITRTLGPAQFGLFSLALAVMGIASQFSDFGIRTGLVRFASLYLKIDKQRANLIFKVSLKLKLLTSTLIFLIGFISSYTLAVHVFEKPELTFPFKLAFVGAFGTSLFGYILATLQARQSFKFYTLVKLITPLGKMTLIGILFLTVKLNLQSALITVIFLPFIAFLIGSLIIPKDFLKVGGNEKEAFHELYHFSKWILVSIFSVMIFQRIDVLMLGYFKPAEDIGLYSAGYTLALLFPLITGTITTVLLPKVSEMSSKEKLREYTKKSLKFTIPIIFPLIILLSISQPLILFIYGARYFASAIIFQILIIGFSLTIIINPISLTIYSLNRPEILAYLNVIQLLLNFLANLFLIPLYSMIGAAIATLLVQVVGTIFIGVYVYLRVMKKSSELSIL
jgi:O-antigen/teichoic acid export membrane protein